MTGFRSVNLDLYGTLTFSALSPFRKKGRGDATLKFPDKQSANFIVKNLPSNKRVNKNKIPTFSVKQRSFERAIPSESPLAGSMTLWRWSFQNSRGGGGRSNSKFFIKVHQIKILEYSNPKDKLEKPAGDLSWAMLSRIARGLSE